MTQTVEPVESRQKGESKPTPLAEFLDQYERIARNGVCPGPRYRIGYSVLGDGPPLYVVPGICTTRTLLAPLAVELSRHFRVVTYDLAGVDQTDGARLRPYGLDDFPRDLFHLADHLGDDAFPVMGLSFGVAIAVRAMTSKPTRITRAMLVSGFVRRELTPLERLSLNCLQFWPGRLRHIPYMKVVNKYNHALELECREAGLHEFMYSQTASTPISTTAAQVKCVSRTDLAALLPLVEQPVLVVHGAEDRLVPTHHAAELANALLNVRIMLIPRCGHVPQLTHPELLAKTAKWFFLDES